MKTKFRFTKYLHKHLIQTGMTRYSKFAPGQRKKPEEATGWKNLQPSEGNQTSSQHTSRAGEKRKSSPNRPNHGESSSKYEKSHKSEKGFSLTKFGFNDGKEEELLTMLKKETRRENRRVKRQKNKKDEKVCYNCREHGHNMSECPKAVRDVEQGTGICFKCGSTEHSSSSCRVKVKPGEFPYAKCFICGETGHLSKQCPDNPKGLYPMGGCCKECGSVEHYVKDCPESQAKQGIDSITLPILNNYSSADAEDDTTTVQPQTVKKKVPKLVKF